jgi:hypothetical protein
VVRTTIIYMQRCGKNIFTIEGLCFLRGPCRGVILKTTGAADQLRDIRRTVTTWAQKQEKLHCYDSLPGNVSENTAESCYQAIWQFLCITSTITRNLTVSNRKTFSWTYYGSQKLSFLIEKVFKKYELNSYKCTRTQRLSSMKSR